MDIFAADVDLSGLLAGLWSWLTDTQSGLIALLVAAFGVARAKAKRASQAGGAGLLAGLKTFLAGILETAKDAAKDGRDAAVREWDATKPISDAAADEWDAFMACALPEFVDPETGRVDYDELTEEIWADLARARTERMSPFDLVQMWRTRDDELDRELDRDKGDGK